MEMYGRLMINPNEIFNRLRPYFKTDLPFHLESQLRNLNRHLLGSQWPHILHHRTTTKIMVAQILIKNEVVGFPVSEETRTELGRKINNKHCWNKSLKI